LKKGEKITEGKTKIIWSFKNSSCHDLVLVENKDDVTAGDGLRHDVIEGKGVLCAKTAANVFLLLQRHNVANHFVRLTDERTFLARRLTMSPVEIVVRRKASGSYCQRHPRTPVGKVFNEPIVEFYLKDNERHDPIIVWNEKKSKFELYNAHTSISPKSFVGCLYDQERFVKIAGENICLVPRCFLDLIQPKNLAIDAFAILERAWQKQNYILSDFKVEVGWNQLGEMEIGDVICNDEWRLQRRWPLQNGGKFEEEMSKQRYRDLKEVTQETLADIRRNYQIVAEASDRLL